MQIMRKGRGLLTSSSTDAVVQRETSSLALLEHRVYGEMGQSDWRSEKHLIDLAEEFGFYPECN